MTTERTTPPPEDTADPGANADNWITATVFRMRAVTVAAKRATEAIQATRQAHDELTPELTKGEKLIQQYLEASDSISGRLVQMYKELIDSVASGQTKRSDANFGRLEDLIGQYGGSEAQELLNALRQLRGGGRRASKRSRRGGVQTSASTTTGEQSTDLGVAVAQGKMKLGW